MRATLTSLLLALLLCTAAFPQPAQPAPAQTRISPQQAEQLFHSVDQILQFAAGDTGFPILHPVKRRLTSRAEIEAYLRENVSQDKNAARLRRSELVLKKFGLLPQNFDLQNFLVTVNREQIAGYYDAKTKYVNLLDWVDADAQKPVLAHELTHALQDQSFDLEKWLFKDSDFDLTDVPAPTPADLEKDEVATAREALAEGQAMVVLLDYMLAPTKQNLLGNRRLLDQLKQGMLVNSADSPVFSSAPEFIKQTLTFPYIYGVDFVAAVLEKQGKNKAFSGAMQDPPLNSRQIMEPQTYLAGERLPAMPLPNFSRDLKSYDRFDIGAVGEFDTALLIDQYSGVAASHRLCPHWRGGYYYAARIKNDPAAPLSLMYLSRWSGPQPAAEFAAVYAQGISQRYPRARSVSPAGDPPSPATPNPPLSPTAPAAAPAAPPALTGSHTWLTTAGPITIEVRNDMVFITEGLDQPATDSLQRDLFGVTN